jgi:hypothetical protein
MVKIYDKQIKQVQANCKKGDLNVEWFYFTGRF